MEFIKNIKTGNKVDMAGKKKNSGTSDLYEKGDDVDEEPTTGSTLLSTEALYNNRSISCTYCKRSHTTSECDVITDVPARKAILRKKARCFVCLKGVHIARQCTSTARWFKCHGRQHISICEQQKNYNGNRNAENATLNPAAPKYGHYSGVTMTQKSTTTSQTAQANVISDTGKSASVRLLFDSCSQKSFANSKIRQVLNLPLLRKERMVLKAYKSRNEEPRVIDVVRAKIKGINKSTTVDVELYVVSRICSPISCQTIELAQVTYEHIINLELADSTNGSRDLKIDVLIGGDLYWKFITGQVIRGQSGPPSCY